MKKVFIYFLIASISLAIASFSEPVHNFEELSYIRGVVTKIEPNGNGVGARMTLLDEAQEVLINVKAETEKYNLVVRDISAGEQIKVWYAKSIFNINESWQVEYREESLLTYDFSYKYNLMYSRDLRILSLIFFVASILVLALAYFKSGKK